jgi:peptide/nickel transport system substrate-binding protein
MATLGVACGDDGGGTDEEGASTTTVAAVDSTTSTTSAPEQCDASRTGGMLRFGEFLPNPLGLDPATPAGARGVLGGTTMAALYDTLLRFDPSTGSYEPHAAESFSSNDDATEWTVKLRAGVHFGSGNPLTSAAVKASIARHQDPARLSSVKGFVDSIADIATPDDLTVVFRLTEPWGGFPWLLAGEVGMITDPAVVAERGDKFATNPAGAGIGPFELVSYVPGEETVLRSKPDYWGGSVCIDELRFVHLQGAAATYQALRSSTIDVAFLREAPVIADARDDGMEMYVNPQNVGAILWLNNRPDAPTSDPRVRQAVAAAIDPALVDQRAAGGEGMPTSALIGKSSRFYDGGEGPQPDLETAKRLVAAVRGEGVWDGSLRLLCNNIPPSPDLMLSVETQLRAAGIDAKTELLPNTSQRSQEGSFDLLCSGVNVSDAAPYIGLTQVTSTGRNISKYQNPEMDALVKKLKAAQSDDETKAALAQIQALWNETLPGVVLGVTEEAIVWADRVHGLRFSQESLALFDTAFVDR